MKRIKYLLFALLLTLLCGSVSARQFSVQCEAADLKKGDTTRCHVLINSVGTERELDLVETRIADQTRNIKINSIGSLWTAASEGGVVPVTTNDDEPFTLAGVTNFAELHQSVTADGKCIGGGFKCYDFYSQDGFMKFDNQFKGANVLGDNENYTSVGYFVVELTEEATFADCGRLCLDISIHEKNGTGEPVTTAQPCANLDLRRPLVCACEEDINDEIVCYGEDGEVVPGAKTSEEACPPPPSCEIRDGKYYDEDGEELDSEEEFKKVCGCRKDGNDFYDDNGKKTTEENFKKVCGCRKEDDKYYDDDGDEVEEEEFKKICGCRKDGDDYYDDKGEKVDEEEWKRRCEPYCYYDEEQDKYFLKPGEEITKEFYENSCTPTGSFASYAILLAGVFIAISAITIAQKHNKFYRV